MWLCKNIKEEKGVKDGMGTRCPPPCKKREEKEIAHVFPEKFQKRAIPKKQKLATNTPIHHILYTCTPWFDCMPQFSMDPLVDFTIHALQVSLSLLLALL